MKSHAKKAIKEAERLGYEYVRTNSSAALIYTHPIAGEVSLNQSMNEVSARHAVRHMQKAVGAVARAKGRDATAVKDRRGQRAELEAQRLAAERRSIEAHHAAYLERVGTALLTAADRQEIAHLEARLREIRELERLMTDAPVGVEHTGPRRARHRGGSR